MPGTIFHHKHVPVSLSLFRGFFSTFCEFTGLVQYLLYPNMKVRASKSSSLLQDKSEQLLWSYNGSLAPILTISSLLGSLVEYRASPSRAFTRGKMQLPTSRKQNFHEMPFRLRWSNIHSHLSQLTLTSYLGSHHHSTFNVNTDLKLSSTGICQETVGIKEWKVEDRNLPVVQLSSSFPCRIHAYWMMPQTLPW